MLDNDEIVKDTNKLVLRNHTVAVANGKVDNSTETASRRSLGLETALSNRNAGYQIKALKPAHQFSHPSPLLKKKSTATESSVVDRSLVNEESLNLNTNSNDVRNYMPEPFQTTFENPDAIYDNSLLDSGATPKQHRHHQENVFGDPSGVVNLLSNKDISNPSGAPLRSEDSDPSKALNREEDSQHFTEEQTTGAIGQPVVEHPEDYPVPLSQQEDNQVDKIMHDVKMEGEDPIADDNYYSGKQQQQSDNSHDDSGHKSQNVHMSQHEYDVAHQSHDSYTHDTSHADHERQMENYETDDIENNQPQHGTVEEMSFMNNEDSTRKAGIPPSGLVQRFISKDASSMKNHGSETDPSRLSTGVEGARMKLQLASDESRVTSLVERAMRHDKTHEYEHDYGKHRHYGLNGQLLHFDLYNDQDKHDDHDDEHAYAHHHEERYRDKEGRCSS